MELQLEVRSRGKLIQEERRTGASCVIGTDATCDIVINAPNATQYVSGRHARITLTPQSAFLEDLGSSHGTFVLGRSLTKSSPITAGVRFTLGRMGPEVKVKSVELSQPIATTVMPGADIASPSAIQQPPVVAIANEAVPTASAPQHRGRSRFAVAALGTSILLAAGLGYFLIPTGEVAGPGPTPVPRPMPEWSRVQGPIDTVFALLIGVSGYNKRNGLTSLSYPESDVEELERVLTEHLAVPRENVVVMSASRSSKGEHLAPRRANIVAELEEFLTQRKETDRVLIAFAGHGVQFGKEAFLCPADTNLEDRTTLIAYQEIYDRLERCPARSKILITDACRDNPLEPSSRLPIVDLESSTRPQECAVPGGIAIMFGCGPGQKAWESANPTAEGAEAAADSHQQESSGNGIFFYHVAQGLRGAADTDENKRIDFTELHTYVHDRVQASVWNKYRTKQTPTLQGEIGQAAIIDLNDAQNVSKLSEGSAY